MLGICTAITYEGQAAILLETAMGGIPDLDGPAFACPVDTSREPAMLGTLDLFRQVHDDWQAGRDPAWISRAFHLGLISGLAELAGHMARAMDVTRVALSGGVMQNLTMATLLPRALAARGLTPLTHRDVPPNDACISLGQAVWGARKLDLG